MHEVAGTIMRARIIGKGRRKKKIAEVTTYPSRFAMYDTPFFSCHRIRHIFRSTLILIDGFLGRAI